MVEIERKFLVTNASECIKKAKTSFIIAQGYLSKDPARTVRVRICEQQAFLTIKGASSADGTTRIEWEKEISVNDAEALLPLCLPGIIRKIRHHVYHKNQRFEVDVFEGELKGLIVAEIELETPTQKIDFPNWLGKEITGDIRYYNSVLAAHGIPD